MQQLMWQQFMTVLRMGLKVFITMKGNYAFRLIKCADYCALTSLDTGLDVCTCRAVEVG